MRRLLRENFPDAHFRRQMPVRDFVADFASHGLKLVVEVDGGQHGGGRDVERTALIEAEGYRVVRFWNHYVPKNDDSVMTALAPFCGDATPTQPSPIKGGGLLKGTLMARLNYVELTAFDVPAAKRFYEAAFGWTMTAFGPTYAATMTGDTDIGIQGDSAEAVGAPLPVIEVDDLEAALAAVLDAGGTLARPIFSFPGGRRFQFLDPGGNELAVMQADPAH